MAKNRIGIDSRAKQDWNLNDLSQQEASDRETQKLWSLFQKLPDFEFKSIEDVLNELNKCNAEVECINDAFENNLTDINRQIQQLESKTDAQNSELVSQNEDLEAANIKKRVKYIRIN